MLDTRQISIRLRGTDSGKETRFRQRRVRGRGVCARRMRPIAKRWSGNTFRTAPISACAASARRASEAFEQAALALTAVIADPAQVASDIERRDPLPGARRRIAPRRLAQRVGLRNGDARHAVRALRGRARTTTRSRQRRGASRSTVCGTDPRSRSRGRRTPRCRWRSATMAVGGAVRGRRMRPGGLDPGATIGRDKDCRRRARAGRGKARWIRDG